MFCPTFRTHSDAANWLDTYTKKETRYVSSWRKDIWPDRPWTYYIADPLAGPILGNFCQSCLEFKEDFQEGAFHCDECGHPHEDKPLVSCDDCHEMTISGTMITYVSLKGCKDVLCLSCFGARMKLWPDKHDYVNEGE